MTIMLKISSSIHILVYHMINFDYQFLYKYKYGCIILHIL